jgi:hypothetical protein
MHPFLTLTGGGPAGFAKVLYRGLAVRQLSVRHGGDACHGQVGRLLWGGHKPDAGEPLKFQT